MSPEQNARFEQQYRNEGLAPTAFAVFLGLLATFVVYLVAGLSGSENVSWYEGIQAQRVHRMALISAVLLAILGFWSYWKERWTVVAYIVLFIIFSIGPVAVILMGDAARNEVVSWRGIASQMICIVLAFTFLRLPLKAIVLTALPSSIAILLMIFDSLNQRLIASSMVASILVIGISVWLTIYLRERRLFEQTVLIEAAAATERQYADLVRQEKRSLIHDIRQPMSAFAIHMGILRTAQSLTPDLQDKLSTLGFAFDALAGQVDEFARESKGSGNTELMPSALQEVDVIRVVTNVVQLHEPLAASKSTKLTAVYGSGLTGRVVRTNSIQLSNVLQLMVGNAIKFNQGTKVRVSCKVDRGSCSIHITDTGPGIERSNLESIFEAGFSTSPDDTNSQGLGLFNVRRIITGLSDHSVRVRSKPGHYTCFKLTLPLARLMSGPIDGLRMLVVDDEPSITRGLATLFEGAGAVVNTADSATRAMTIVQEDDLAFEMLVCDHDLGSGPNGLDLIQQVREYYDTKVPAILVSGRLAQIGGNTASVEVVSKPFNSETLLQLVERCAD